MAASAYDVMRLTSNVTLLIFFIIMAGIFEAVIEPYKRGFFCDDESIQKPYLGKQTVPTSMLVGVQAALIFVAILLAELVNHFISKMKRQESEDTPMRFCCVSLKRRMYRPLANMIMTVVGLCTVLIITGIGKTMIGRLRPHFIAVCKPDYSRFNCSSGYITLDVCTQTDDKLMRQARLSFPSGHASTSMYTATFLALYVEYMCRPRHFFLAVTLSQLVMVCLGVACSLSRVSDYMHHWSDVLAGGVLGTLIAFYTVFVIMRLPEKCDIEKYCLPHNYEMDVKPLNDGSKTTSDTTTYGSA